MGRTKFPFFNDANRLAQFITKQLTGIVPEQDITHITQTVALSCSPMHTFSQPRTTTMSRD